MLFFYQPIDKYKFTSKTGGFESYDSRQLLRGGMVEVNSEPFRIAWFARSVGRSLRRAGRREPWERGCSVLWYFTFSVKDFDSLYPSIISDGIS